MHLERVLNLIRNLPKAIEPSAGFCSKPSARRLTPGSCLPPSPIKKANALGEMEELELVCQVAIDSGAGGPLRL